MKTAKIVTMFTAGILLFSGCQATPDQSSVASKAEGLSEELMAEPLEPGELQEVDLPGHWSVSEKKSNDRVTILADLEMGKLEMGNLPVFDDPEGTGKVYGVFCKWGGALCAPGGYKGSVPECEGSD